VSVCSESVEVPAELLRQSVALLESYDWNGVAMVEYKHDRATGKSFLMEVNGRFWGSLQLAVDSGVDFPALLASAALGNPPEAVTRWQTGIRSRWRLGEVDHLLARLRSRGLRAQLPDLPSLGATIGRVILPAWGPGERGEVFRFNDPMPGVREWLEWLRGR
jgi:predicted ATP-grasp superfamily ATP-dependent carboligase